MKDRRKNFIFQKGSIRFLFLLFAVLVIVLSIWGPEKLERYKDRAILNEIHTREAGEAGEGYRYSLNGNERLYILSRCLGSQILPESEQNALTKSGTEGVDYQELEGVYAFVVNHRGPSGKEITDEEIYEICNQGLADLKGLGILPDGVREVEAASYDAVLYSAIDVLEPRNNVGVWKVSLSNSQRNAHKENRLIDAYIDADDGRIYEFYVRTALSWEELDVDGMATEWSRYLGLSSPEPYESVNPLLETTPYFKKYVFPGMRDERTVVTVGFYEGINELFLKISR